VTLRVDPNVCERCAAPLYYSQRAHGHRWCARCASILGVEQLGGLASNLRRRALDLASWWRWTLYLGHAVLIAGFQDELEEFLTNSITCAGSVKVVAAP
jgi:hypothetical protein